MIACRCFGRRSFQWRNYAAYADSIHLHMIQESLWQSVNTIHLLAALAEEESSSEDVKETQRMICAECEKIQQQL